MEKEHKKMIMNKFYDEMHLYLNAFDVLMLYYIFGELDDTLIITPKGS